MEILVQNRRARRDDLEGIAECSRIAADARKVEVDTLALRCFETAHGDVCFSRTVDAGDSGVESYKVPTVCDMSTTTH